MNDNIVIIFVVSIIIGIVIGASVFLSMGGTSSDDEFEVEGKYTIGNQSYIEVSDTWYSKDPIRTVEVASSTYANLTIGDTISEKYLISISI